ncbi:hypothetical protein [Dickeya oryzae]
MSDNNHFQFRVLRFLRTLPFRASPGMTTVVFLVACSLIFYYQQRLEFLELVSSVVDRCRKKMSLTSL